MTPGSAAPAFARCALGCQTLSHACSVCHTVLSALVVPCRFRLGRQEDAHEYLRCVLDAMAEAFLKHIKPKPPPELASTTFIHRIFGGKLRSEVCGRLQACLCAPAPCQGLACSQQTRPTSHSSCLACVPP